MAGRRDSVNDTWLVIAHLHSFEVHVSVVPLQFQNGTVHHETERGDLLQAGSAAAAVEQEQPEGGGGKREPRVLRDFTVSQCLFLEVVVCKLLPPGTKSQLRHSLVCDS